MHYGRQNDIGPTLQMGERILRTTGGPSCVARNRYRLRPEIPLSWEAIVSGILDSSHVTDSVSTIPFQGELTHD